MRRVLACVCVAVGLVTACAADEPTSQPEDVLARAEELQAKTDRIPPRPTVTSAIAGCTPEALPSLVDPATAVNDLIELCGEDSVLVMNETAATFIQIRVDLFGIVGSGDFPECVHLFFSERSSDDVREAAAGAADMGDLVNAWADTVEGVCRGNAGPLLPHEWPLAADAEARLYGALADPDAWLPWEEAVDSDTITGRLGSGWFALGGTPEGELAVLLAGDDEGPNDELRAAVFAATGLTDPGGPIDGVAAEDRALILCGTSGEDGAWSIDVFSKVVFWGTC